MYLQTCPRQLISQIIRTTTIVHSSKEVALHKMGQRTQVINLYKTLVYLGREYPLGWDYFRPRLKTAFMRNKDVTDPEKIEQLISRGNYVVKEIEALYMLRKYRTLKKRCGTVCKVLPLR